jgi:hypothetical protein
MQDTGLKKSVPGIAHSPRAGRNVVGQGATILQKRSDRETTPGPRPHPLQAGALVLPVRPLTLVTSEMLEEPTPNPLHRQATGLEADLLLLLHQGRMESTVERPAAPLRQSRHPTRRTLPTQVQTRSTADLDLARLPLSDV